MGFNREVALNLRERGWSHFQIAEALGLSLTEVRRLLDPKAERAHQRWSR